MSSNYGIYGPAFELGENKPFREGSEEYLNSEKYELKHWDLDAPRSLRNVIATVNRARHENSALQTTANLHFHATDNPQLIAYSKSSRDGSNTVLTIVNLDPFYTQSGWVSLDLDRLGLSSGAAFPVHDLLSGQTYQWQGRDNYVELSPDKLPAHIFRI
jgi:starch synthase (maltosyl-transferring)